MAAEEAAAIKAAFKSAEANESPEFKAFQKKLIERQILLEERDYFNKREKRIIKTFGSKPFSIELPDPQEEAFRMKAYAALEKTVIEKQEKAIAAELERLFPDVKPDLEFEAEQKRLAELGRKRDEMEKQLSSLLAKVENEVDEFKKEEERKRIEAERKRLEEERRRAEEQRRREEERRRQMELERQRLERERFMNRYMGSYHHSSHNGMLTAELRINANRAECLYRCTVCGGAVVSYSVKFEGDTIKLGGTNKRGDTCTFHEYSLVENYAGTLNSTGTVLNGVWHKYGDSVPITFYKV
jgi:hypothetical protein